MGSKDPGDAFKEGLDAYGGGFSRKENPHPEGSDEREEWFEGWDQAEHYATDEEVTDNL
jgi:ribosome modulation factor